MTILWLYLIVGCIFAFWIFRKEEFPRDTVDWIAYTVTLFIAIVAWPAFMLAALIDIPKLHK